MMRVPKTVRVGCYEYTITRSDALNARYNWGETDNTLREIRLASINTPQQDAVTLLHELMHAVEDVYCLEFDEKALTALSHGLAAIMQDLGCWPRQMKREKEESPDG